MTFKEVCQILAGPPWNKEREQILKLDPNWVGEVLFCERHPDGRAKIEEGSNAPTDFRGQLLTVARGRGWDEELCQRWADEQMDRQAAGRVMVGGEDE